MNYLVLGSSGQIGSSLTNYLQRSGETVICFDIVNDPSQDLRIPNNQQLIKSLEQADFVFFLAFDVGGSRYLKTYQNSFEFVSNNIRIMENTFSALNKTNKPFIFVSSQMSNMTYSPYGRLKALGELYTTILGGLIVKFWNVYGVEKDLEKSHVITDFLLKAKKTKLIEMMTDGEEMRQFLYADDCSECLLTLAKKHKEIPRDQEIHITNFAWNSIYETAKIVSDLYPGTVIKRNISQDEVQKDKRNEPNSYILNFWKPKTSLQEGIRLVKENMEKNLQSFNE